MQPTASSRPVDSSALSAALSYAACGWKVVPLFTIREDGACDCPDTYKRADANGKIRCAPGKHPRTEHGRKDASADEATIRRWFEKQFPRAGVAIDLETSGLVDIAPDSVAWLEAFSALGLPRTACFRSGGGAGHEHYLYRRPEHCPITKINRPGEYDLQVNALAVMPPTRHASLRHYEWLVGPEQVEALPPVPEWGIDRLRAVAKRNGSSHATVLGDEPPVRLHGDGLERWHGRLVESKPGGELDRSDSLFEIGRCLAQANASRGLIVSTLEERDAALGWGKYVDRPDGTEYERIADKALAEAAPRRLLLGATAVQQGPILSSAPRVEVADERKVVFHTAREIALQTPAETAWLVHGLIARGGITEVDGKVKQGGKTTLITHLSRAVLDGRPFLGFPTTRTKVVYLTEQPPTSFRQALHRAQLLDRDDFVVVYWHENLGIPWEALVDEVVLEAERIGADLVITDTLGQFAGLKGEEENSSGKALEAIRPLQLAAGRGLAIVIVRHDRKSGGDVGDSGRGSSAFAGAVDVILAVRKGEGNSRPTIRVLHSLSRFEETPETLVIELVDGAYVSHGSEGAVALAEAKRAILKLLAPADLGDEPRRWTSDEIREALSKDVGKTMCYDALRDLDAAGQVVRSGIGKRGDPRTYALASAIRPQPPVVADKTTAVASSEPPMVSSATSISSTEETIESEFYSDFAEEYERTELPV